MHGRELELTRVAALVEAGLIVDIVGSRSSGRTSFLGALRSHLENLGWTVLTIRATVSLRDNPLAALHLADIGSLSNGRRSTVQVTHSALHSLVEGGPAVVLIDDWKDLDEASWGIIDTVRRQTGLPLVRSRLRGTPAEHTPSGLSAAGLDPAFIVDLGPLPYATLESILKDHLGAPIEISTMSRIHEKSGGNVGLALSLVDVALQEDLLQQSSDGFWIATGGIWSSSLRGIVEAQLLGISSEARDALDVVAHVGIAELETMRRLISWDALEDLEDRGLLRLLIRGGERLVNVYPPLLVDYFRHDEQTIRHIRLAEHVGERLGSDSSTLPFLRGEGNILVSDEERDALLRGLLVNRAHTRQIVTRAEWEASPTPATAVRYASALVSSNAPQAEVERVLRDTHPDVGDPNDRVELAILTAQWQATVHNDLAAALATLDDRAPSVGPYRRLLDAEAVVLTSQLSDVPADWDGRLAVRGDEPLPVLAGVLERRILLLTSRGRFEAAIRTFERLDRLENNTNSALSRLYFGLALIGEGSSEAGVRHLSRGLEEATEALDIEGIRVFGAGLAAASYLGGNFAEVDRVLQRVYTLGDPPPIPLGVAGSIVASAVRVAFRRGDYALAAHRAASSEGILHNGGLLGQFDTVQAQNLIVEGKSNEAADVLWETADSLWGRGAWLSGSLALLLSLEIRFDADRHRIAEKRIAELDGPMLSSNLRYVSALDDKDPEALLAVARELSDTGRYGIALNALRMAAARFQERRDTKAAQGASRREQELIERLLPQEIESYQLLTGTVDLSDREREIARMAARGLSNQEIADNLVLSVRTVESHMYHALRKLGLNSRQSLRYYSDTL